MPEDNSIVNLVGNLGPQEGPFSNVINSGLVPGTQPVSQQTPQMSGWEGKVGHIAALGDALVQGLQRGKMMAYMGQEQQRQQTYKRGLAEIQTAMMNPDLSQDQRNRLNTYLGQWVAQSANYELGGGQDQTKGQKKPKPEAKGGSGFGQGTTNGKKSKQDQNDPAAAIRGIISKMAGPNLPHSVEALDLNHLSRDISNITSGSEANKTSRVYNDDVKAIKFYSSGKANDSDILSAMKTMTEAKRNLPPSMYEPLEAYAKSQPNLAPLFYDYPTQLKIRSDQLVLAYQEQALETSKEYANINNQLQNYTATQGSEPPQSRGYVGAPSMNPNSSRPMMKPYMPSITGAYVGDPFAAKQKQQGPQAQPKVKPSDRVAAVEPNPPSGGQDDISNLLGPSIPPSQGYLQSSKLTTVYFKKGSQVQIMLQTPEGPVLQAGTYKVFNQFQAHKEGWTPSAERPIEINVERNFRIVSMGGKEYKVQTEYNRQTGKWDVSTDAEGKPLNLGEVKDVERSFLDGAAKQADAIVKDRNNKITAANNQYDKDVRLINNPPLTQPSMTAAQKKDALDMALKNKNDAVQRATVDADIRLQGFAQATGTAKLLDSYMTYGTPDASPGGWLDEVQK